MSNKFSISSVFSKVFRLLYYLVVSFVCLITAFLLFYIVSSQLNANNPKYRPAVSLYTIVSPSMTPVIKVYDIVVNFKVNDPSKIQIGDIITYISASPNSDGMTITHRVIEVEELEDGTFEYLTQGDNNSSPDNLYITYDQVIGKEVAIIPYLGKIQFLIANKKGWLFLLLIPIAIFIFRDSYRLIELLGLRKKVDKVAGLVEDPNLALKKEQEDLRKEQIKKELKEKEVIRDSFVRSPLEPLGFLDNYTEDIIDVNDPQVKEVFVKPERKVIDERIEILDTDELTIKIKEYDRKLAELESILSTLKSVNSSKFEDESDLNELDDDNFLKGSKIKVIKQVSTKNRKKSNIVNNSIISEKEDNSKKNLSVRKVLRQRLNLDPKNIPVINRYPLKNKTTVVKAPVKKIVKKNNKVIKVIKPGFITIEKRK